MWCAVQLSQLHFSSANANKSTTTDGSPLSSERDQQLSKLRAAFVRAEVGLLEREGTRGCCNRVALQSATSARLASKRNSVRNRLDANAVIFPFPVLTTSCSGTSSGRRRNQFFILTVNCRSLTTNTAADPALYILRTLPVGQRKVRTEVKADEDQTRSKRPGFFTLPVAYFARMIDFRSYIDATMSLYSIKVK